MAFITSGAFTVGRVISTYATNMAAEQDIWSMIKNIASNFFKALNQALKERGYTLGGAALWGGAIIALTVAASYAIYYVLFRRSHSSNQTQDPVDPARIPLEKLKNAFNNKATHSREDLEAKLAEVTATKGFDLSKRSAAEQSLINDVQARVTELRNSEELKQKKQDVVNAKKALEEALKGVSIETIEEAYTAYKNACTDAGEDQAIERTTVNQRIQKLKMDEKIKAFDATSNDQLTQLVELYKDIKKEAGDDCSAILKKQKERIQELAETACTADLTDKDLPALEALKAGIDSAKTVIDLDEKATEAIDRRIQELKLKAADHKVQEDLEDKTCPLSKLYCDYMTYKGLLPEGTLGKHAQDILNEITTAIEVLEGTELIESIKELEAQYKALRSILESNPDEEISRKLLNAKKAYYDKRITEETKVDASKRTDEDIQVLQDLLKAYKTDVGETNIDKGSVTQLRNLIFALTPTKKRSYDNPS